MPDNSTAEFAHAPADYKAYRWPGFFVIGTLATRPTDPAVLRDFYGTVRPFGWWGAVRLALPATERLPREPFGRTALNVVLGMCTVCAIYVAPMYLVGHWYAEAGVCLAVAAVCVAVLKKTWYEKLVQGRGRCRQNDN